MVLNIKVLQKRVTSCIVPEHIQVLFLSIFLVGGIVAEHIRVLSLSIFLGFPQLHGIVPEHIHRKEIFGSLGKK